MFTDRVLVQAGRPQRYGTQFSVTNGRLIPHAVSDAPHLDELRASVGLPTMADYVRTLGEVYKLPVVWPPAGPDTT